MITGKEIRIEARVRNNILWHAIFDCWPTVAAFCREKSFYEGRVGQLLNLKLSPINAKGKFIRDCVRLAETLDISCELLFPLQLYKVERTQTVVEVSFAELPQGGKEIALLPAPQSVHDEVVHRELRERIQEVFHTLTPREELVLRLRFGQEDGREWTYEEIGKDFELTRERIRQIEIKALRRIRDTRSRSKRLEEFTDD